MPYMLGMVSILTLSGWAQSPDALLGICPDAADVVAYDYSQHAGYDALAGALTDQKYDLVMGWSLGGQLALRLVAEKVLSTDHLILLCAPHSFVRSDDTAYGMERWLFDTFYQNYIEDPDRTANRFSGLIAKGDAQTKDIIRALMPHEAVHDVKRWEPWLNYLGSFSISKEKCQSMDAKVEIVHGSADTLVKLQQSEWLANYLPNASLTVMDECAHAPQLHSSEMLSKLVERLL